MLYRQICNLLGRQAGLHDNRTCVLSFHVCECGLDFLRPARHYYWCNLDIGCFSCKLGLLNNKLREWIGRVRNHANSAQRGKHIAEKLHTFAVHFSGHKRDTGDVGAWLGEARH